MTYILDTNILLLYIRESSLWSEIKSKYDLSNPDNTVIVSAVTVGEIYSIAKRNKWGKRKLSSIKSFVNRILVLDINNISIIETYANIDAFSQGKLEKHPLNLSARNMGKNDLWIAATASVLDAHLITLDKDFSHLHENFIQLIQIDFPN